MMENDPPVPVTDLVQQAYARAMREGSHASLKIAATALPVGILAYLIGAPGLVICLVQYLTVFVSFRVWRRRYERRTRKNNDECKTAD